MRIVINGLGGVPTPPVQYGGIERGNVHLIHGLQELGYHPQLICKTGSTIDCDNIMFPDYQEGKTLLEAAEEQWGTFDIYHDSSCNGLLHYAAKETRPSFWTVHGIGGDGELCAYLSQRSMQLSPQSDYGDLPYTLLGIELPEYLPVAKEDFIIFIGAAKRNNKYLHYFTAIAKAHNVRAVAIIPEICITGREYFDECRGEYPFEWVDGADDSLKFEYLRRAKCVVHCSHDGTGDNPWQDASPAVVLEGLAVGTPVIGNYSGGIPEMIQDGITGFLVRDAEQAIEAYTRIEGIDPRICRDYVERERNHVVYAQRMVAVYEALAGVTDYETRKRAITSIQGAIDSAGGEHRD